MIRLRAGSDLDACVKALAEVHAADRYPVDWPADPARWLSPPGLLRAWVAVDEDGRVTGHVGLARPDAHITELADTAVAGEVTRLFVAPGARGGGLAAKLLDTVLADSAPLALEVSDEGRAAIACYERQGWRLVARSRASWLNAAGHPALLHHYVSS